MTNFRRYQYFRNSVNDNNGSHVKAQDTGSLKHPRCWCAGRSRPASSCGYWASTATHGPSLVQALCRTRFDWLCIATVNWIADKGSGCNIIHTSKVLHPRVPLAEPFPKRKFGVISCGTMTRLRHRSAMQVNTQSWASTLLRQVRMMFSIFKTESSGERFPKVSSMRNAASCNEFVKACQWRFKDCCKSQWLSVTFHQTTKTFNRSSSKQQKQHKSLRAGCENMAFQSARAVVRKCSVTASPLFITRFPSKCSFRALGVTAAAPRRCCTNFLMAPTWKTRWTSVSG